MKRFCYVTLTLVLTGCAGGSYTTQLLTQSTESEVMPLSSTIFIPKVETSLSADVTTEHVSKVVKQTPLEPVVTVPVIATSTSVIEKPVLVMVGNTVAHSSQKFTIQVVALSHNKGFTEYMDKLPSDKPVWSNQKMVDSLPWYTLLYGTFDSKHDAKHALTALPNDIKQYGPFIRSFSSIEASSTPKITRLN